MVTAFVIVFAAALVLVSGLVVDGGRMLTAHREAGNLADSAARAGAQAVDDARVRAGDPVVLDAEGAVTSACSLLATAGRPCGGGTGVTVSGNAVTVTVSDAVDLLLLPGGSRSLTAEGTACVAVGITSAEC